MFGSAFPALLALPAPSGQNWTLQVGNSGPGTINISADGQLIDGGTAGIPLVAGQSLGIFTDGDNYFTVRGYVTSPSGGGGGGGGTASSGVADRATFFAGFGAPIMPGSDSGARHIVMRAVVPMAVFAHLTDPPVSGDFIFDILGSQDSGGTWMSILAQPIVIPAGYTGITANALFASGASLAPGNLLRLLILSAGDGPGYSNGFICSVRLDGATIPGWDRATFVLGLRGNVPVGVDLGAYWIATRTTQPATLYCTVTNPPLSDAYLDIQVFQGGEWQSLFLSPLLIAAGNTAVTSTTAFTTISIAPGDLLRPMLVSGPASSGSGYTISLEFDITG